MGATIKHDISFKLLNRWSIWPQMASACHVFFWAAIIVSWETWI